MKKKMKKIKMVGGIRRSNKMKVINIALLISC